MDEIIKTITAKTGITDEQARQAVQATVDFIKSKIPPMFASQLDRLISGGDA
jgi:nucleoid DNA-binding protein